MGQAVYYAKEGIITESYAAALLKLMVVESAWAAGFGIIYAALTRIAATIPMLFFLGRSNRN
jgi:hypothetical protein